MSLVTLQRHQVVAAVAVLVVLVYRLAPTELSAMSVVNVVVE